MRYIAYTVKGLEKIAESELLQKLEAVAIVQKDDKLIIFNYDGDADALLGLKTIDDIGLFICNLTTMEFSILPRVINQVKILRQLSNNFSITTSVSRSDINKAELEGKVISELTNTGLVYTPTDRSNLDFRLFLNDHINVLSIRLTKDPLNKRTYEFGNYLGALKPTIAASMVQLATANLPRGSKIVDNFCGSGTILCEAVQMNYAVYGGDISSEAVTLAQKRLKFLGEKIVENIRQQDAIKTKWNGAYFDCAISNFPWDKQHEVTNITALYSGAIQEYKRILRPKFTICIICHKPDLLIKHIKKNFAKASIYKIDIGYLGQTPSIVMASN